MTQKLSSGTDGWRGVMAFDFTVDRLKQVVQAIMDYIGESGPAKDVYIGYDTRFLSGYYAQAAAGVVAANGGRALVSAGPVGTPMVSLAVRKHGGAGGIMITASHNPCYYNGIKFKAPYGGSATPDMAARIDSLVGSGKAAAASGKAGSIAAFDYIEAYRDHILGLVDTDAIKASGLSVVLDCMHGSAACCADELFGGLGLERKIINTDKDAFMGGMAPEPMEENLSVLSEEVKALGADIGFATDGDADRVGVVGPDGVYVTPHEVLALLIMHMKVDRKMDGAVVKTVSTSSLVDRVAEALGLTVYETPVGFKHICGLMLSEDVLIGGEENGGLGIKGHIPERDGLLAALLLVEMMAVRKSSISELVGDLHKDFGRSHYKRLDVAIEGARRAEIYSDIKARAKDVYAGFGVAGASALDGYKLRLKDGSWILFRVSGTEPVLRIYCEADSPERVEALVKKAKEAFIG